MNYLYVLNYNEDEGEMCALEMRRMMHADVSKKYFFSDSNIPVTTSLFTKYKLAIKCTASSLEELIDKATQYVYEDYKVQYLNVPGFERGYRERCHLAGVLGEQLPGMFALTDPSIILGFCEVEGVWYFGELSKNTQDWHKHDDKPHHFSTALPVRQARTIVNIAVGDSPSKKLVDPCCGVGTVLLEACGLGYDIEGFELHYPVKQGALKNVQYYGYTAPVLRMDMKDITKKYDTAIIDIPYGLFTHVEEEEQQSILNHARKICDELILVSNKEMDEELKKADFEVIDRASVTKQRFVRYIMVAK